MFEITLKTICSGGESKSPAKPRYLPGYLSSETMAELWSPQPGARMSWGGHDLNYGLGWAVRPRKKNYGYCQVRIEWMN